MSFRRIRDRGIPVCLGTDEAIADDAVNLWAVAKQVGLIHNLESADFDRWPQAEEILDCLIGGGARAISRGSIFRRIPGTGRIWARRSGWFRRRERQ